MEMTGGSSPVADDEQPESGSGMIESLGALAQAAAPMPLSVGQQLRLAREAKGMTLPDVARALKLSPRQVEALEADDWSRLPGKTIIRGFVRNDARLLGLNSDFLMSELDKLNMPKAPDLELQPGDPVSIPHESGADRRDYVRVFSGLIILGLAIAAFFLLPQNWWQSTLLAFKAVSQSNEVIVEREDRVMPAAEERHATEPALVSPEASVIAEGVSAHAPAASPEAQPASKGILKFTFSKPAWVEVRDRSGEIIFSRLNLAGSKQNIEGEPPFALIVGNASYVILEYKGKPVELSNRSKDDVSRLSLE